MIKYQNNIQSCRASPQAQLGLYGGIREPRVYLYYFSGAPMFCSAHVRGLLDRSTFFHIWFLQNQIFQFCPLDFDRKNVHACTSNIHQYGDSKEAAAKGTSPGGDPIGKAKNSKTRKKGGYAKKKHRNPQKARKNSGVTEVANTAKKRKCRSCRAYPLGRARIWTTSGNASANRSAQLDRTRKCPPPRNEPAIPSQNAPSAPGNR